MYECFQERQSLWVVLELCRGGELYEHVAAMAQQRHSEGGAFPESEAKVYFRQMLYAVSFLHKIRIVHRDIKTENFLLLGDQGSPEGKIIKLCDFGTAVQLSAQMPRAMGRIGTLSYTAPEIYARRGADLCADIWSLGVVLYVLLVGASPFRITGVESRTETSKRILAGSYDTSRAGWLNCSERAKDFMSKLMLVEEPKRLQVLEALRHPWLASGVATPAAVPCRQVSPISDKEVSLTQLATHAQALLHLLSAFSRSMDVLQRIFLAVYAQVTPDAEIFASLRLPWYDLFLALDQDCDGQLGLGELGRGLEQLMEMGSAELQEVCLDDLIASLDLDQKGYVSWVEWTMLALCSFNLAQEPEPLQTVFRIIDRPSGDGIVTVVDLMALLDGTGRNSSNAVDEIRPLLEKWSSQTPAGLRLTDVRRLLQAAAQECWLPGSETASIQSSKHPGWLGCCEQAHQDARPESISKHPAFPSEEIPPELLGTKL
ncbi:unnamed protein product [Effrenium voratum]|uniref:Uncharacterized protein n=1 Tax=Effrenium voratum TaxID=2562239 RepID=A0AA36J2C8_9DINO|nr:unnamed protein product [Effrenium voratum]